MPTPTRTQGHFEGRHGQRPDQASPTSAKLVEAAITIAVIVAAVSNLPAHADDWPQWMGPERDGHYRESGVLEAIPPEGLRTMWSADVQLGYSGPAVADGRVYVMDYVVRSGATTNNPGGRSELQGEERVLCFSSATGDLIWKHAYDRSYKISYPGGPRCTPTVDGDRVYALGAEGNLCCLDSRTGRLLWDKDLVTEYDTEAPVWGFAAHPLVDGDALVCVVGGKGSVAVAFDKRSGREIWKALSASEPGYCPPTMITHANTRQLLIWHAEAMNGLDPRTGKTYWSIPLAPGFGMSIMAPRKQGDLLYASAIGNVAALMKLDASRPEAKIVWRGVAKQAVYCSNSTPFIDGTMIYGCDVETGALVGARLEDGERLWQTTQPTGGARRARHATAFLVKHQDRYFLFNEQGDLILAHLSPEGYQELGRAHLLDPTNEAFGRDVVWSHPAFAERSVFARNDRQLVRVSLAAE